MTDNEKMRLAFEGAKEHLFWFKENKQSDPSYIGRIVGYQECLEDWQAALQPRPDHAPGVDENELREVLTSLITEQACGEWSEELIRKDVDFFVKALSPYLLPKTDHAAFPMTPESREPFSSFPSQGYAALIRELLEPIRKLMPFELVQGDSLHRVNPSSKQVVNTSSAWAASNGDRSAHKIRTYLEALEIAEAKAKKQGF